MKLLKLMRIVGLVALMLALAATGLSQPVAQSARELVLTVGKSLVVNSAAPIERVSVGFGDIAEARAVGPQEVLLDAKAPGETTLIIWQQGGSKLFFDVIVRPNTAVVRAKLDAVRRQLQEQLPGQNINAAIENDNVFLTGTAKDLVSANRAAAIAGAAGKVVNLLYVELPSSEAQVLLKVQFATVDKTAATELGANLISTGAANTIGSVTTGQFGKPTIQANPGSPATFSLSDALNVFLFRRDLNLAATIRALQTRGLFEILAEPNVLAINGKPAAFLSGGEFPYPILQGGGGGVGTVTIAFREFGVRIGFLPLVTERGTIRLDVTPEVSALDYTAGLTVSGFTVPGLSMRRVQTEIELQSGQSFAIAGLLDRRLTETMQKIPGLANIPLLGKIFTSKSTNRENNELLVIVTPEIVRPLPQGQPLPQLEMPGTFMTGKPLPPGTTPVTAAIAPPKAVPMEDLLRSMQTETNMKLQETRDMTSWPGVSPYPGVTPGAPSTPGTPQK